MNLMGAHKIKYLGPIVVIPILLLLFGLLLKTPPADTKLDGAVEREFILNFTEHSDQTRVYCFNESWGWWVEPFQTVLKDKIIADTVTADTCDLFTRLGGLPALEARIVPQMLTYAPANTVGYEFGVGILDNGVVFGKIGLTAGGCGGVFGPGNGEQWTEFEVGGDIIYKTRFITSSLGGCALESPLAPIPEHAIIDE